MAASRPLMAAPPLVHAINCLTKWTSTPLMRSLARAGAPLLWTVSLRGMESPEEYMTPDEKHSYCFVSIAIGVGPTGGVTCLDCWRDSFCLSHRTSVVGPQRGQHDGTIRAWSWSGMQGKGRISSWGRMGGPRLWEIHYGENPSALRSK
jgi:hypothetical protein